MLAPLATSVGSPTLLTVHQVWHSKCTWTVSKVLPVLPTVAIHVPCSTYWPTSTRIAIHLQMIVGRDRVVCVANEDVITGPQREVAVGQDGGDMIPDVDDG